MSDTSDPAISSHTTGQYTANLEDGSEVINDRNDKQHTSAFLFFVFFKDQKRFKFSVKLLQTDETMKLVVTF